MNCQEAASNLARSLVALGQSLSTVQEDLFARYCALLLEANNNFNLTAMRSPDDVCRTLFLDSILLAPSIPPEYKSVALQDSVCVVDLGSGAGIPGLPLKILFPHWSLVLIESIGKKAGFLVSVADALNLRDVRVLRERAEIVGGAPEWRDAADLCFARAVGPLSTLVELCAPLVSPGGRLVFPKSGDVRREIGAAEPAARALGCSLERVNSIPVSSGLGENRYAVVYCKRSTTPDVFPRRVGEARSKPIGVGKRRRGTLQPHERRERRV